MSFQKKRLNWNPWFRF